MRLCARLLPGPKRARSTPTLVVGSSNSGSPGRGKEDRRVTGPSSSSGARPHHEDEAKQFKEAAKHVLALMEKQLAELLERGDFVEVKSDE
jgi:hypothetical protein